MKHMLTVMLMVTIMAVISVVAGCGGQTVEQKASDEAPQEVKKEAQQVLPILYRLQDLEKDPTANAAQIQSLKNQVVDIFPGFAIGGKPGNWQIPPTDEAIEFMQGVIKGE